MCGIVGIYNRNSEKAFVSKNELERMRDKMVHRGPNDSGIWISDDNRIGLAHRRLSIIDLNPSAAQPMTNAICKKHSPIWIVFNGEIYNHQNLRQS
jgi:asparagine synthase (glutamine-hydrolysing)